MIENKKFPKKISLTILKTVIGKIIITMCSKLRDVILVTQTEVIKFAILFLGDFYGDFYGD